VSEITVPVFGDPETVKVEDLRPGDFVIEITAQQNVRRLLVNSAVKVIDTPTQWTWYVSISRKRHFMPSRYLTFQDPKFGRYNVPAEFEVIVRRPR
jgi:hypothetical protein